ncbi:uncharacterized protein LOC119718883 [Patiria miniata]|uniref:TIR domain-containing protein n=1 Tax=Patiria miniata TaxID=46514 RepID=A0A913YZS1_PATMI|nr:uncharacterized protein LOC119718883 [Patiria miniata]XP_038044237.1 uncharacterized protein LOC119718883 [Patiria miniata]XP_038044238.1 uncharacterized protein LOC119718883 [Patiria miniata]
MVMFGNYGVSQSYLHRVTPQVSAMADPANSQIDGSCAAHAKADSAETSTPPAHCETQQSERAEAATRSTFAHPLSTEEELMALDVGVDGQSVPEGISDLSEPSKESETSVNVGASLSCSSGTETLKSADRTPKSHRKALRDNALDSEAEEVQLSQSQGSSSLSEAVAAHSTAGSDMDETLTKSAESASSLHSSSLAKYDFVMWYHPDDDLAAERIYKFLEGDLGLKGYRYCRDRSLGKYKLSEMAEAIRDCSKVLLFITPRSNDCGMFESQVHNSLNHSIESNRKKCHTNLLGAKSASGS